MENYELVERASRTWTAGAVRPGRYSGGVFRVAATMRWVHRAARRTLLCVRASSLDLNNPRWRRLQVQNRKRRFIHGGEYANTRVAMKNSCLTRDWHCVRELRSDRCGQKRGLYQTTAAVFLEDAGNVVLERVRNAVEKRCSVKVNIAFNDELATKDKCINKNIITKNSEIYRCTDIRRRAYPSIVRRVLGMWQRVGIVANPQFDC